MGLEIYLVGEPRVRRTGSESYRPRSRKTWALLAYLLLTELPPSRQRLSSLLFGEAADPLGALRWSLAELRRLLGPDATLEGDPVTLNLPADTLVDFNVIAGAHWSEALKLPGLGAELLEGHRSSASPEFESWLLAQRRHIAASTEAILHEAVLALLGRGKPDEALPLAIALVGLNPYLENHQAVLIRTYVMSGDRVAADLQLQACTELFADELGISPGPTIRAAVFADYEQEHGGSDIATVHAVMEAGRAAVGAGAPEAGVMSLRSGVALADSLGDPHLAARSRLALADALVHAVRGDDSEGALILHEAVELARESADRDAEAEARTALGYIDMLGARYDRALYWLTSFEDLTSDPNVLAKTYSYLGVVESDRAKYDIATEHLQTAVRHAENAGDRRTAAYALSLLGRIGVLRGDLDEATRDLNQAIDLGQSDHWLAFLPWPQAFLGEVQLMRGDQYAASEILEQAFARACQIGDPCWEGVAGRGLALIAESRGDTKTAFGILEDARDRCNRLSDTYMWAEAYILDAQSALGLDHGHESTGRWVNDLYDLASRTGMRELLVRAMLHRGRLWDEHETEAAASLAKDIQNPMLHALFRNA